MTDFRESDMYEPIKVFFAGLGYDVKGEVKGCDITLIKDGELIIIEMKKSFNMSLLFQALDRQTITPQVYVAIPAPKRRNKEFTKIKHIVKKLEIGLITVSMESALKSIDIVCLPPVSVKSKNPKRKEGVIGEAKGRLLDLNKGGSTKTKLATVYREKCIEVACALFKAGEAKCRDLINVYGCGKGTASILRANYYGWFEVAAKSVYRLSESGTQMLGGGEFADLVRHYTDKITQLSDK